MPGDAAPLARLHLDVWDDAYRGLLPDALLDARRTDAPARVGRWRERLGPDQPPTVVAETTGGVTRLLGFASAGPSRDDPAPAPRELWALYVRAAWWGAGVGHALATEVLGDADASLWVLEGNERALAFYRRQGFVPDGATKDDDVHRRERRLVRLSPGRSRTPG